MAKLKKNVLEIFENNKGVKFTLKKITELRNEVPVLTDGKYSTA